MFPSRSRIGFGLALLSGLLALPGWAQENAGHATASAGATSGQYVWPYASDGDYPAEVTHYAPAQPGPVSLSALNQASAGSASAYGSASFLATAGGIHVTAFASAGGAGPLGWSSGGSGAAAASAASSDTFTLYAPAYALGTLFTVKASVYLQGLVGAIGGGNGNHDSLSSWQGQATVWNSSMSYSVSSYASGACWNNRAVPPGCGGDGLTALDLQFTVANGMSTSVSLSGSANARVSASASDDNSVDASAWADLGHTIGWGGISALLAPDLSPVADFSALSATTGFDYRQAYVAAVPVVPEPASAALLIGGLLGLGIAARRRQRLSRPGRP